MSKDASIIKVLADIGLRKEPTLTDEQEEMFQRVVDPDKFFEIDAERLFKEHNNGQ